MSDIVERLRANRGAGRDHWKDVREAAAEIERLRSLVTWRDIESAPKDGTWVLGKSGDDIFRVIWREAVAPGADDMGLDAGWSDLIGYCFAGNSQVTAGYKWEPVNQPTHWLPLLPPPPAKGA